MIHGVGPLAADAYVLAHSRDQFFSRANNAANAPLELGKLQKKQAKLNPQVRNLRLYLSKPCGRVARHLWQIGGVLA